VAVPPSGEQFELSAGELSAVVVEVGGGLRALHSHGEDVLDGYGLDEMCTSGRGQILVPWPNRIDRGEYEWRGRSLQLALTEPSKQNAIHGLARWSAWTPCERSGERVVLEHTIHAQSGYPFTLHVRLEYTLDAGGLTVRWTATNQGGEPAPFGAGAHPYLKVGGDRIDQAVLQVRADTWYENDDRGIPRARWPVAGSAFDYRRPRPVGGTVIDTAFSDLERDADGRARVTLTSADGTRSVRVWLDENHPYLMLFTGDSLPDVGRRRRGLGVEPMTCAPNAFRTGEGLKALEPGEAFSGAWGIEPVQQA
jgi:aldose 1-epimerase